MILGYRVFYTARPSSKMEGWVLEPVKGDKLSTIIVGLEKNTRYYFKALARNKQGDGPYSAVVEYQTLATGQQTPGITLTAVFHLLQQGMPLFSLSEPYI